MSSMTLKIDNMTRYGHNPDMKTKAAKRMKVAEPSPAYGETQVKIADLKANLSRYLHQVRTGGTVTVFDRKTPIARIQPYAASSDLVIRPATTSREELRAALARIRRLKRIPVDPVAILLELRKDKV